MTYIVDKHNGKGAGVSGYSLPSERVGTGARPGCVEFRGRDGICKGRGDKEERSKQHRETEHVDVDGCEGGEDEGKVGRNEREKETRARRKMAQGV